MSVGDLVEGLQVSDLADMALVAVLLYGAHVALRRARSTLVLYGLLSLSLIYLIAVSVGMRLTAFLFQGFFTLILVVVIVIFQEELRAVLERIAAWLLRHDDEVERVAPRLERDTDVIVSTMVDLARDRTGALVVLRGNDPLKRHLSAGTELDGFVSEPLLKSLFDDSSLGHDGAVVIENGRISRFSCHLPLSTNEQQLGNRGTRHSAGLGLSEQVDALCIVVSEERGSISLARHGELVAVRDAADLRKHLLAFHREIHPPPESVRWLDLVRRDLPARASALALSVVLWFFFSHEAVVEYHNYSVPVTCAGLSDQLAVDDIEPREVQVIVSGPRRAFYFVGPEDFSLVATVFQAGQGVSEITLAASDVTLPKGLSFVNLIPRVLAVSLKTRAE